MKKSERMCRERVKKYFLKSVHICTLLIKVSFFGEIEVVSLSFIPTSSTRDLCGSLTIVI